MQLHMKTRIFALALSTLLSVLASCVPNEPIVTDHKANFEALWKIMDERYCFFEEKGVDWDAVHAEYARRLEEKEYSDLEFFNLMGEMLNLLKDGHVNLISPFDITTYDDWRGDPTVGLNIYARAKELPGVKLSSGGMAYQKYVYQEDKELTIGYISYGSFSSSLGNLSTIFQYMSDADGLIIDVRGNGGGALDNSSNFLSRFFDEKTLVGYMSHKTGTGHSDFSEPMPLYIEPFSNKDYRWTEKPVLVLQDRSCYSAANDFLYKIDLAKNVTRLGLKSGGGGGIPASQELPNGWTIRFSSVKNFDAEMNSVEEGIDPDLEMSGVSYYTDPAAPDVILRRAISHFYLMFHPEAAAPSSGEGGSGSTEP